MTVAAGQRPARVAVDQIDLGQLIDLVRQRFQNLDVLKLVLVRFFFRNDRFAK